MIDILMATYNGEHYLEEQLASIESQTWTDWRLIVHDDASSDGTWRILENFQKRLGKEKVIIKKNNPASGSAKANFIGLIQASAGDYMMCCDQDDVWHLDKVARTFYRMRQMEKRYGNEIPLLVHTDLCVVDEQLSELNSRFHSYMNLRTDGKLNKELIQNQVTGCTVMINKALRKHVAEVTDVEPIVMHDHWLALIALVFGKMSYLNKATIDYRQHGDNSVGAQNARSISYMWQRFLRGKNKFRQDMRDSCCQVGYFVQLYVSCIKDEKVIELLDKYSHLYEKNKMSRIFCFFQHNLWKKGVSRKIMQVIWG